ncbi:MULTISPECIES: NAD(P)/FAD-dependent oxidoreductase [unclassified Frankia]|uniref:phytoene desaturase family protein n=1 Tax=unclassified Frankia TaxID=2632575 RepID=UPI001EF700FC|nr:MULTISPECIES: phytoene desaturase family protein [unclassified Frankia]
MARVVVVGAGVGGLATAARLAAAGHRVTICERASDVGGKLGRFSQDGFTFDTGPSLLTMPEVFADLFAATGAPLSDLLELRRLDPIARYRFADGTLLDAHADDDAFTAELDAVLPPGSGQQWRRLAAHAERLWEATREPFLSAPTAGVRSLASLALRRPGDISTIAPGLTLRGLGQRHLADHRLRMFLDRYATYTGSDPRRAPAALAVIAHVERCYGGWYLPGGLHQLGQAVAERAVCLGARLLLDQAVIAITRGAGGRAAGVQLADGGRIDADLVVSGVDAQTVYGMLAPHRRAERRLRRARASLAGFVLLLALRGRTPDLAHHTVLFPADNDDEFDAVFGGRLAVDPTIYISAPDDPALAPPGCEAWFVLVNAAPHATRLPPGRARGRASPGGTNSGSGSVNRSVNHGLDWERPGLADAYAARILNLMAERGLDVRERLRWQHVITPADLEQRTGAVGGAIYGTSSNGLRAAFLRPGNRSPIPGLFLVGGSSHPGGGLPLVAMSAKIVADMIGPA